jgi:hypothetical protein
MHIFFSLGFVTEFTFFTYYLHSKHMLNSVNFSMAHNGKKILATTEHYILISLWSPTFSWNDYMLVCRNHLICRIQVKNNFFARVLSHSLISL